MFSTNPAMEAEEIMKSVDIDHNGKIDYNGSLFKKKKTIKKKKSINKAPLYLKNSHWLLLIANKFLLIKGWKQLLKCLMRMQMVFFHFLRITTPPLILKGYISLAEMRNVFSGSSIKDNEFW